MKKIRKAIFPVAGLGTRLLPATKAMPKEMLTLVDRPLIQWAVDEAKKAGIEDFIFVTSMGKNLIEDHFDRQHQLLHTLEARNKLGLLELTKQTEIPTGHLFMTRQHTPLGLGHAIWCARNLIGDEPFAVLLPDEVVLNSEGGLEQLMKVYNEKGGNVLAMLEVPKEETARYGVLDIASEEGHIAEISGMVEKPDPKDAPSNMSITGRYILQPEVFEHLARHERGAGNEIQLTDAIAKLIGSQPVHGCRFEGQRYDCGNRFGFLEANIAFALARKDMREKVKNMLKRYSDL